MMKEKMKYKKAYLSVEDFGQGMFSGERILKVRNYTGELLSGFFDKNRIKDRGLEVDVLWEEKDIALVMTPGLGFFQRSAGNCCLENSRVFVKKEDLLYSFS